MLYFLCFIIHVFMYVENREQIEDESEDVICISDDNDAEIICLDTDDEDDWQIEALDDYIDCIPKESSTTSHSVKQEKVDIQDEVHVKKERFHFETPLPNKRPIKKEVNMVAKKFKRESSPVESLKKEENDKVQERDCQPKFNFPKKPKVQNDSADNSIVEVIHSITEKFNAERKNETLKSKARIICMHLLSVKEKHRTNCLSQVTSKLDEYLE